MADKAVMPSIGSSPQGNESKYFDVKSTPLTQLYDDSIIV